MRSINPRSSSRRRWDSKRRTPSRSSSGWSPEPSRDCAPGVSPSERRMRWTSTPTTPEPSPRRPKAATARLARSRICPSAPSMIARRIASRSASRSSRSESVADELLSLAESGSSISSASSSVARKNQRSKTRSKILRSSCDLTRVAASASRNSCRRVHGTTSIAANASRISAVPIATSSERNSSQKPSSLGAKPSSGEPTRVTVGNSRCRSEREARGFERISSDAPPPGPLAQRMTSSPTSGRSPRSAHLRRRPALLR